MNPYFNENTVLAYIKKMLGSPFNIVEFDDEFIIKNVILDHTFLKEFSQYFPKEERVILSDENNEYRLRQIQQSKDGINKIIDNRFHNVWILDSDNEILGVKRIIYTPLSDVAMFYGDMSLYTNPVDMATYNLTTSIIDKPVTHHFYYPNKVEVKGYNRLYKMMAILDTVHDQDLSSIPSSLHIEYQKLCLYNTANLILGVRSKYQNLSTPFGEISLNLDWIQQLADKKQELLQQFKSPGNFASRGLGIVVI